MVTNNYNFNFLDKISDLMRNKAINKPTNNRKATEYLCVII